ncbi:MAG: HAMP domain-containing histidine kinase [Spirochaetaceae bacterium]|jgi:signal transduction histidine kinase|nr:HAMP domain-containing histidine kinase [Spirochaetaceae bacterium]
MKRRLSVSLQNRLTVTYILFISAAIALLALVINLLTNIIFANLVKENIKIKSGEIARAVSAHYNPMLQSFDKDAVENIGMYFVHEGYIVSVEDKDGGIVWDARACDMRQCRDVIANINRRMKQRLGAEGGMRKESYPVRYKGETAGAVIIESYSPFFYSEAENEFLQSMNKTLLATGILLCLLSAAVSRAIARGIARPVNRAGAAARAIAQLYSSGAILEQKAVKLPENYRTRELAGLSVALNRLAGELANAERRQKRLCAAMAHELRTPLTCLRGNLEAILDGVFEPDAALLQSCHEEVIRLAGLAEGLTKLSSFEWNAGAPAGPAADTPFNLAKLLESTAEQFRAAAAEKGVTLHLKLRDSPLKGGYDRLKQVFINLLSNAVKYTDSGSISVSIDEAVEADAGGDLRWLVTIADTGSGIAAEDIPHIFECFYRADKSRGRGTGGAGIGLTIAEAIIHARGGSISVESAGIGKGSVFRVLI